VTARRRSWAVTHSLTPRDKTTIANLRALVEPNKGKLRGPAARAPFDAIIGRTAPPEGVTFREDTLGGVRGWWCEPSDARPNAAILHLHGGLFNLGSAYAFRHLVGHIGRSASVGAFVPEYRLAPEHPFPSAVHDAQACFQGIVERGFEAIAVSGDSAGGNLALSLLSILARQAPPKIRLVGGVVLSPMTDLLMTGSSWETRAAADPIFVQAQVESLINAYLNGHDPADPIASPLYGDFVGLPPIRVHVGNDEVLLDDSLRLVERAVAAGVDATVDVWEGMPHGFIGNVGALVAAGDALAAIGAFLSTRFGTVDCG
jgi:monoterpene epsilon-lactone hydrolase